MVKLDELSVRYLKEIDNLMDERSSVPVDSAEYEALSKAIDTLTQKLIALQEQQSAGEKIISERKLGSAKLWLECATVTLGVWQSLLWLYHEAKGGIIVSKVGKFIPSFVKKLYH